MAHHAAIWRAIKYVRTYTHTHTYTHIHTNRLGSSALAAYVHIWCGMYVVLHAACHTRRHHKRAENADYRNNKKQTTTTIKTNKQIIKPTKAITSLGAMTSFCSCCCAFLFFKVTAKLSLLLFNMQLYCFIIIAFNGIPCHTRACN